nr:MBL fold metallo-hydrolase [Halalkalibacterium ligniniphilum]
MSNCRSVGNRISLIDGFDLNLKERTGTYVIHEKELTLIETGPSLSVPHILEGLKELDISSAQIRHIIVTHIHLDHSGGLGLLLNDCINARVYVHPRGARHLVDPSRLIKGAKAVYGDMFERLFTPILPVPEDKITTVEDGDELEIGPACKLEFLHTPGHAAHHISILDPVTNGIFTGDTLGVRYEPLSREGIEFVLPSTSPNQFHPEQMLQSLKRIRKKRVERIYFGHFSVSTDPEFVYSQINHWLPIFVEEGKMFASENKSYHELADHLLGIIQRYLREKGIPDTHPVYEHIRVDLFLCSMGILEYLQKRT